MSEPRDTQSTQGPAVLWASAFLLAGLILFKLSGSTEPRLDPSALFGSPAHAGLVSSVGEFTLMTVDGGTEDILLVIDNVSEEMLVYRVENQRVVNLEGRYKLPEVFEGARRTATGQSRP